MRNGGRSALLELTGRPEGSSANLKAAFEARIAELQAVIEGKDAALKASESLIAGLLADIEGKDAALKASEDRNAEMKAASESLIAGLLADIEGKDAALKASEDREARLTKANARLKKSKARLKAATEKLWAELKEVRKQLAAEKRRKKRQAAPFSKDKRKKNPDGPGRKKGEGPFSNKKPPSEDEVTDHEDVEVEDKVCGCGGKLEADGYEDVFKTDIPDPKPRIKRYRMYFCRCTGCGKRVRAKHPDVAEDQRGATAHRYGDGVMARAHLLHYGLGIPVRKVPKVMRALTGIRITQSAITQDAQRRTAGPVGEAYKDLRNAVRGSPGPVHTDDTGWSTAGERRSITVYDADNGITVFTIMYRRRNEEVREVIGDDFMGTLITDRAPVYDAVELAEMMHQKCMSHILRSLSDVREMKVGRGRSFTKQMMELCREAVELWWEMQSGEAEDHAVRVVLLSGRFTHHLRDRIMSDPDNQRLLDDLGRRHDNGQLLRFLYDPRIEPTNNRAERRLRSAVVARKVSQCSKSETGERAREAMLSVIVTLGRRNPESLVLDRLEDVFRGTPILLLPAPSLWVPETAPPFFP